MAAADRIYKKHPNVDRKRLVDVCNMSLLRYGLTGDACISIAPPFIAYCFKKYYEEHPSGLYGKQSRLITKIKY